MSKKILVTGIGGNVGQGILRNILSLKYDIKIIGTDTKAISAGNHFCDKVYQVPFSGSDAYIPSILKICEKEHVDLIIPSTDYESYFLALAKKNLPTLASSEAEINKIFLDKYLTWVNFNRFSIPFTPTCLPSQYKDQFEELIVKPREGVGSKDIHINPGNPKDFSDKYIIQKVIPGKEITTAFYVTKNKKLLGQITFLRSLVFGATNVCEVTFAYDKQIEKIIHLIIENFDIKGSCNIQSIVDDKGVIFPFEVNCRISGTNSIRGQFGFEDVKYTVDEYLFNKSPKKPVIKKGSAIRILMDVIYPDISVNKIRNKSTKHHLF